MYICSIFFLLSVAKDIYSYYVTLVWFCNVALWDISLYWFESGDTRDRLIRSHWFGSQIMHLWYYPQRRISPGAKFHPSPPHSQRGGGGELPWDPGIQMAVWMGLVLVHDCKCVTGDAGESTRHSRWAQLFTVSTQPLQWNWCPGGRWASSGRTSPCGCSQRWSADRRIDIEGSWGPSPWPGCSHPSWL